EVLQNLVIALHPAEMAAEVLELPSQSRRGPFVHLPRCQLVPVGEDQLLKRHEGIAGDVRLPDPRDHDVVVLPRRNSMSPGTPSAGGPAAKGAAARPPAW